MDLARRTEADELAQRALWLPEGGVVHELVRRIEVRVIKEVEKLRAEFNIPAFPQPVSLRTEKSVCANLYPRTTLLGHVPRVLTLVGQ